MLGNAENRPWKLHRGARNDAATPAYGQARDAAEQKRRNLAAAALAQRRADSRRAADRAVRQRTDSARRLRVACALDCRQTGRQSAAEGANLAAEEALPVETHAGTETFGSEKDLTGVLRVRFGRIGGSTVGLPNLSMNIYHGKRRANGGVKR